MIKKYSLPKEFELWKNKGFYLLGCIIYDTYLLVYISKGKALICRMHLALKFSLFFNLDYLVIGMMFIFVFYFTL